MWLWMFTVALITHYALEIHQTGRCVLKMLSAMLTKYFWA